MNAVYYLIPMSLVLLAGAVGVFLWSLRRGQYEDLESPAHSILIDDREQQLRLDELAAAREKAATGAGKQSPDA
ncbi:MAG: cbb3-type cytochrome oxidase assembly protein CcoS [Gammaproteobacteria bacterium]